MLGVIIRVNSIYPYNIILGFDQARDLFESTRIYKDIDLKIIGPTAGNNPNMHHGVLYLYYILIPLMISGSNPIWVAIWNAIIVSFAVIVIYIFSKKLFRSEVSALISAFIIATSNQLVQFSGWLSNPGPTVLTVPIFFLGLWLYYQKNKTGLILAAVFLGLSIQFELFFIYLIPIMFLIFLLLRMPFPDKKTLALSLFGLTIALSTMIMTEVKYNFGTVVAILSSGSKVSGANSNYYNNITNYIQRFNQTFEFNLFPDSLKIGGLLSSITIVYLIFKIIQYRKNNSQMVPYLFLLIYLLSSGIMLLLGYHNAPWFLIGLPPAIALAVGKLIASSRSTALILIVVYLIGYQNIKADLAIGSQGQILLEPDPAALVTDQIRAIDYTYKSSGNKIFSINTLTNPLYINAVWAYDYMWYGQKKYGFLPTWTGGDQIYPYNTLPASSLQEQYLYLLIDRTNRIPYSHKLSLMGWADEHSKLLEEKSFGGILVQKRILTN